MQRIPSDHFTMSTLKKSRSGLVVQVYGPTRTELTLISSNMVYADGKHYGIDVAHIDKPRAMSVKESWQRGKKLGRPLACWLFENDNWNISAMLTFVKEAHTGLRPDDIYKGTMFGKPGSEISYQARVLKEGFKDKGVTVRAPAVLAWTPEALLDYAQRIHLALKTLGDYQTKVGT